MPKLPAILAIILYCLIYLIRFQQGGWPFDFAQGKVDLFKEQRLALDQRISHFLPSPQAQLLSGILLGQNHNLPNQLRLALRDTSTLHIVVASGQNLSMIAGFLFLLSGLIKRQTAIALSFLAIILYTLLTGAQVPILRAAIMVGAGLLAQIYGREKQSLWIIIITASIMLLINPLWLFDLSFQLSFLATFGVIVVAPILFRYFKIFPLIGQDLAVTTGAQLMILPVIAQTFHQLSLVGVFTNLLVGWTIPFIMILGSISLIFPFLSLLVSALLTYFIYIVQFFASLPFAWEYIGEQLAVVWIGYYLVLVAIVLLLKDDERDIYDVKK